MAGPGNAFARDENVDIGLRPAICTDKDSFPSFPPWQPAGKLGRVAYGGRQANEAASWRPFGKRGKTERKKIAALGRGDGMDLVNDHAFEVGEEFISMIRSEEEGELFRRR